MKSDPAGSSQASAIAQTANSTGMISGQDFFTIETGE
jgi:hypothetical protein